MKIDVQTLGTFNQLAHEGAQEAAASLNQLTGIDPTVEATTVDLARRSDVISDFRGRELVGVTTEFSAALTGTGLLVFDRAGAQTLVKNLPGGQPDSAEDVESRVTEVGNILMSGFIDGWANHLGARIDHEPPTLVSGTGAEVIPEDAPVLDDSGHVIAFSSFLETTSAAVEASVYLFPEQDSFEEVVLAHVAEGSAPIPLDKLQVFNRMTVKGAQQAGGNVSTMTGTETRVEISRLRFLPVEHAGAKLGDDRYVGITTELDGLPSGYLLVLFDEDSAGAVAEGMGAGPVDGEFGAMGQSAIEEIGNIMVSGFVDGWANVLDTSITHSPPEFVQDAAPAILRPITDRLATSQQYAFVFDSLVETTDSAITCEIFALPDEDELKTALDALDVGTAASDASLAAEMEADPDDLF